MKCCAREGAGVGVGCTAGRRSSRKLHDHWDCCRRLLSPGRGRFVPRAAQARPTRDHGALGRHGGVHRSVGMFHRDRTVADHQLRSRRAFPRLPDLSADGRRAGRFVSDGFAFGRERSVRRRGPATRSHNRAAFRGRRVRGDVRGVGRLRGGWRLRETECSLPARPTIGGVCRSIASAGTTRHSYVQWLSARTGERYRLPSEAEWEYVARAGTTTPYHFGWTITMAQANYDGTFIYGAGRGGGYYRDKVAPVGSFAANEWGLHDVHGNAAEWVQDCWHDGYAGAPEDGRAWEDGCLQRVWRGGEWDDSPGTLRSAYRGPCQGRQGNEWIPGCPNGRFGGGTCGRAKRGSGRGH